MDVYYQFLEFEFKSLQRPSDIHFISSEEKWVVQKENPSLQILEYSTLRPKFQTPLAQNSPTDASE